jgi:phosphocarrier protein HPr
MLSARLTVNNDLGLHARAAAQLVKDISSFSSSIKLTRTDLSRTADGKSILSVLTLAASKGTVVEILVDGPDEGDALQAVERSFQSGFGENPVQTL